MPSNERNPTMSQLIDSNATLWQNVRALMIKKHGRKNLQAFAKHCGVGIATIQRIEAQKTSIGLAVIDKIAERFDLAAWQLLVPGFDADNPPTLQPVSAQERQLYDKIMIAAKAIVAEPAAAEALRSNEQQSTGHQ
jgi:transcriptional regulator with XRE-family HTH domain